MGSLLPLNIQSTIAANQPHWKFITKTVSQFLEQLNYSQLWESQFWWEGGNGRFHVLKMHQELATYYLHLISKNSVAWVFTHYVHDEETEGCFCESSRPDLGLKDFKG